MINFNGPALVLTVFISIGMLIDAINQFFAPYVEAFYQYGFLGSMIFIGLFWGSASARKNTVSHKRQS